MDENRKESHLKQNERTLIRALIPKWPGACPLAKSFRKWWMYRNWAGCWRRQLYWDILTYCKIRQLKCDIQWLSQRSATITTINFRRFHHPKKKSSSRQQKLPFLPKHRTAANQTLRVCPGQRDLSVWAACWAWVRAKNCWNISCSRYFSKYFSSINSFDSHNKFMRQVLLPPTLQRINLPPILHLP